jgi:hypothetical protein
VPLLRELGVVDDLVQLLCLLALVAIGAGRLEEAERLLAEVETQDPARAGLGGGMFMLAGAAELALARGQVDEGLRLYVEAASELWDGPAGHLSPAIAPWLLYPQAAALCAHVWSDRRAEGAALHADLVARTGDLLVAADDFVDFPVTGAVLFACAVWDLFGDDAGRWASAVRLLAVADAFAYNRMLPSLAWAPAAELAERRRPGLLASGLAEVAGSAPVDLRDLALALLPATP